MGTRKIKNKIHFSFFILFFWYIFSHNFFAFILFCLTIFSHELGHFFVAKKLGYKLNNFCIASYGVCLNYKEKVFQPKDEILIAFAGPVANFILSFLCISLWWIFPDFYNISHEFVSQSLMLGLFNLLPCYPLDGGRIFVGIFSSFISRKKAIKITFIINISIAIFLFILFFISWFINFNPSFCVCAIFMIFSSIESKNECFYQEINLFNKKIKNYSKPIFLVVDSFQNLHDLLKHIEINRFTIFIINFENKKTKLLDEQAVQKLALVHPLTKTLGEIFKQDMA